MHLATKRQITAIPSITFIIGEISEYLVQLRMCPIDLYALVCILCYNLVPLKNGTFENYFC